MNERIKELKMQALLFAQKECNGNYRNENGVLRADIMTEKFAELIVQEAGEYLMRPEFIGRSDLDWSMILNEHFGVEE